MGREGTRWWLGLSCSPTSQPVHVWACEESHLPRLHFPSPLMFEAQGGGQLQRAWWATFPNARFCLFVQPQPRFYFLPRGFLNWPF